MSTESGYSGLSWRANGSNPAKDDTESNTPDSITRVPPGEGERPPDIPTVEERIRDIVDEYPNRILRPISETHDRKLRLDALEEPERVRREYDVGEFETEVTHETVQRDAKTWLNVIANFLEDYEEYRDRKLRMARGEERYGNYESFLIDLYNSFHPKYQREQYAKLKALKRMTTGEKADESPTKERFLGEFEEPVAVLFALSASSTPNGEYRPVVDHDREIRNAWSGSSNSVKRALRYLLEEKAGLASDEYVWWWQSEPHAGEGDAAGYSHSHPMVILDNEAVDAAEMDMCNRETYRPIVAKHVEVCETAKWSAHRITDGEKSAVKVSHGDEIEDVAAYIADYIQVDTEADLLERSNEYIMWAASQWASSTQKYSKSGGASAAIDADKCHQRYANPEAYQSHDHGARVTKSEQHGVEYECNECGSAWQVSQSPDTLTEHNVSADGGVSTETPQSVMRERVVTFDYDNVEFVETSQNGTEERETDESMETFEEQWKDAKAGGRVGHETVERKCGHPPESNTCPLCCAEGETVSADVEIPVSATARTPEMECVGFNRVPEWQPEAIVQTWSGEETEIGEPSGVTYGEVVVEGHGAIPPEMCIPPRVLKQPEPWKDAEGITEAEIRSGVYPPPEVIASQLAEVHHGERVTPKEWCDDWYSRRYESEEPVEKPPLVVDVEERYGRMLNADECDVVERIEMREHVHPEMDAVQLAAEYGAVNHIEIVKCTLSCLRE